MLKLGVVRACSRLGCEFAFVNCGSKLVEVVEVTPGCGCLKPHLDRQILAPGQAGKLSLQLNTLGVAEGPHNWNLTVRYHDAEQIREQSLQVSATIVTEVSIQPTALNIFTQSAKSHELTLTDLRPEPLQIGHVEVTSPYLRTEGGPFMKNAAGHYCSKIAVHMSETVRRGDMKSSWWCIPVILCIAKSRFQSRSSRTSDSESQRRQRK